MIILFFRLTSKIIFTGVQSTTPRKNGTWLKPGFVQTENHPVVCISWNDASEFTKWLSETKLGANSGWTCDLPTEAQWEKAARGNTRRGM